MSSNKKRGVGFKALSNCLDGSSSSESESESSYDNEDADTANNEDSREQEKDGLRLVPPSKATRKKRNNRNRNSVDIPSFEDLSLCRTDEETVLAAVYSDDFKKEPGEAWGSHVYSIQAKPQGLTTEETGCSLT
jgi:hypothetical protein